MKGAPTDAYPLLEVITGTAVSASIPAWAIVVLGGLLTLAAVPAAYIVGRATTGRRVPGVIAAALLALHPAVLGASIALSETSYALSLTTIGLALVATAHKRGFAYLVGGGLLLVLAGLTAPLCWVVGALAGPLALRLQWERAPGKALFACLFTIVLAVGPVMGFRAAFFGHNEASLLQEFVATEPAARRSHPSTVSWSH